MAKYKITSIPQFAPGGETNWPPDWMLKIIQNQRKIKSGGKKLKRSSKPNKSSFKRSPKEEIEEQEIIQNQGANIPFEEAYTPSTWSDVWPAQRDQYEKLESTLPEFNIDPNQVDKPVSERTGLELISTQPTIGGGYGYKRDPFTGELKIVPAGTQTYERDMFGRLVTNVQANPDIPVDYQGNRLNCPPGSRAYKGVCITEEEYAQVQAKEESNIQYREQVAIDEERKRQEEEQRIANQRWQDYHTKALKKGNKHVKGALDPWQTITKKDWERSKGDEWYNDPDPNIKGSNSYYLDKKDLGNGDYEVRLYPRAAIYGLMSQYGMQPSEFEKYHGINAKNLQKEYEPVLNYLHQYYLKQGDDFIEQYTKQGYSAEQAKKKLKEDKNYGVTSGINKNFKDVAEHFDFQNNADKYYMDNAGVMYTKDRNGNVYIYTNDPQNENLEVINWGSTDANENPFAPVNDKNNTKQGVWTWQPVDKSKVKSGSKGELYINGKQAAFYDHNFKGRDPKKDENTIITNYKNYVTTLSKDVANENKFIQEQGKYEQMNNNLFDQVYGSTSQKEIPEISLVDQLNSGGLSSYYVDAYNEAVRKMNALTQENIKLGSIELPIKKQKDVSGNPEYYQKEKAKILEEFNNKVSKFSFNKVGDKKVNFGALGTSYEAPFEGRNITAYKDSDRFKSQKNQTINQEAQNYLRYAFYNNILPTERNLMNEEYRGEEEGWKTKYLNSYNMFALSPEGKQFLETYKKQPTFGQTLLDEAYGISQTNIAEDKYKKQTELARQRMQNMQDNAPWYANAIDQGMALFTQPYSTINKWSEGKLQAPMVGIMGDSPTTRDLEQLDQMFGTGASSVYLDNINEINQNPISQITSLANPLYFAANTGRGLSRYMNNDPEQELSDIGLDALFAFTGAGLGRSLMGAKVLAPATKYVPQALKTGKYLPRVGNAVTNLVTPSTALNAYFANHAFVPHTDPVTGETVQGFGNQAFNNIYNAIGKDEYGELKVDWDKISPELVNAYMAYSIGKHGLSNANQFAGNLLGKPSLLNTGKLTQPIGQPLQNFKSTIMNPPKTYIHPTTGKIHYINSIFDLPLMNNNRRGVNYKNGGIILPKALNGREAKVKKPIEVKIPKPENIINDITISAPKPKVYSPSFDPIVQTIKNNQKDLQSRLHFVRSLKDLGYVGKEFTGTDMFRAAKSDAALNKLMQLAIEHDRTGYRQVSGQFRPTGPLLDGYGGHRVGDKYDMYKHHWDRPMSQVEHMKLSGVDISDPISLGSYQASTIPFEQYGYRAGVEYVPGGDALYLASLPEKKQYGPYQFKVTMPTDFSEGNWLNWYVKYIMGKKGYRAPQPYKMDLSGTKPRPITNNEAKPGEFLFDLGYSQGKAKDLYLDNILTGSGLQTRRWIGNYGSQLKVDPTFEFTDLFKMNAEQYKKMEDLKQSIIKGYNTGWRGQYKKGGELPEARFGRPIKLNYERPKPPPRPIVFNDMMAKTRYFPSEIPKVLPKTKPNPEFFEHYMNAWNSLPETGWHKRTPPYVKTIKPEIDPSLLTNYYPDSFSPIRFGDDYKFKGEEWYYINPEDYYPLDNAKELGFKDASNSLNESFSKLNPYGPKTFKGIGDFDFKPWSDGWEVRNQMMNAFDGPQWAASRKDFFSRLEFNDLLMKQLEYDLARMKFDEMYPEEPEAFIMNALTGNRERDESFANLFPNVGLPNFRSKFTTPEQEAFIREHVGGYNPSIRNRGMLSTPSLKTINAGLETVPKTFKELQESLSGTNWMATAPAKDVVMEMRGMINRTWRQIENSTPEQLEYYRQQIVKKMNKQTRDRWNRDIETPFKGSDAWRQISSEPGYKNKKGGISMKLSKSEIDKYVKGGYIVEEE